MTFTKSIYRIIRSILFTTVLVVIGFVVSVYIVVSIPSVQKAIKERAESELTKFLGGKVEISEVEFIPFNEVRLYGVSIYEPEGKRCISIGRIGAGINFWPLIISQKIDLAYAELISLNAAIEQKKEGGPLNIDFIIQAFKPKDQNKPPTPFDVIIRNVVIRKSSVSFDRLYKSKSDEKNHFDFNHIKIDNLRADVALPVLKNDNFTIDLRRLAFDESSGLNIDNFSLIARISPELFSLTNIKIKVGDSKITVSDQQFKINGLKNLGETLKNGQHHVRVECSPLFLSDFTPFLSVLRDFNNQSSLAVEVSGNSKNIDIEELKFSNNAMNSYLDLRAEFKNLNDFKDIEGKIDRLELNLSKDFLNKTLKIIDKVPEKANLIISNLGNFKLDASGDFNLRHKTATILADCQSDGGNIAADATLIWNGSKEFESRFKIKAENIDLNNISGIDKLGKISLNANGDILLGENKIEGNLLASIPYIDFNSKRFENINLEARKEGDDISGKFLIDDNAILLNADAHCILSKEDSHWMLNADIGKFIPSLIGIAGKMPSAVSGMIDLDLIGNSADNLIGSVDLKNLNIESGKNYHFDEILLSSHLNEGKREINLNSDFLDGSVNGHFSPTGLVGMVRGLITRVIPLFLKPYEIPSCEGQYAELKFTIKPNERLYEIFNPPVKPAVPIEINGSISGDTASASFNIVAPYLVQGKNKLIKNTSVNIEMQKDEPAKIHAGTTLRIKNEWADFGLDLFSLDNHSDAFFSWDMQNNPENNGKVGIGLDLKRDLFSNTLDIAAEIKNSDFMLKGSKWNISPASIFYSARNLSVDDLRITNKNQFVNIHGNASDNPLDVLNVELAGINLEYVFGILNINYVDFGGIATGKAHVSNLFSKSPEAATDNMFVENLAYNGCILGNAQLEGHWDNIQKMVAINADIDAKDDAWAKVRGGVYVTRDSLAFDFNTKKIDVDFLHPFVSGFTSSIKGKATGHVKLYGTFSDIDLVGEAYADSVSMLVDYTNVYYTGSDIVFFRPGKISIPSMKLFDKYGNSCNFKGEVTHNFLHDASFNFEVSEVKHLLVYDTSPSHESNWYGHVFANGNASIRGVPGMVSLNMNMSTADNSTFTLVLDDNETASNYSFLTFTDKSKQIVEEIEVEETFEDQFFKKIQNEVRERPTLFSMDLALDVTPGANMIIIMDPKAGDKISARGQGPLQFHYDTDIDKFTIYGKYTLASGNYNFSLQELILRNFSILEGSSISFNGDPLRGILDITAAYRVNANLADLDESFKSDPDLNRTSVPVEALLKVSGQIDTPEINFDLSLPTVTSDVERRVKSLISTEDMVNQQIIYLLALSRFYSPEYTSSSQGGELATVASSTISSQIQNIIGSLTDKFSLAPSFKSDKDNFSDMEVDVALSSSLFDNRLLLNGNLGYRDKSTSNTTFIGDFDLEYLLSRDGKLRLKAYNHFNDASYYLRSALTTQGIGIVYRKDFNDPFSFLKRLFRRRKNKTEITPQKNNNK